MSCKHGNWSPCEECQAEDDMYDAAFARGKLEAYSELGQNGLFSWRDVVNELPQEAQEVLFVRGGKTVHGAWIGGIFWHNNQKMAAATWMPLPEPPKACTTQDASDCGCLIFWGSHHPECPTMRNNLT